MSRTIFIFLRSATGRLAMSYLAIIVVLSLGFSVAFYNASVAGLTEDPKKIDAKQKQATINDGPIDPAQYEKDVDGILTLKLDAFRADLQARLALFNLGALLGGAVLSYYLARRTLRPVEAAMEAQSRFASDASHELRTPLTIMQAENEEGLMIPRLPLAARRLIGSNLEEIARLRALSDGLLQLARDDDLPELQPVWADDIATEALNRMAKPAGAKHIAIEDAWPHLQVVAHKTALTQIYLILLDNAIKYSPPKSKIYLEYCDLPGAVQLQVRDTGVGIHAASMPHIFDRFYRVDSARTKQHVEGYGLGLSIAQKLAAQQHCRITVSSVPGEGSTFAVTLPLSAG